jgi:MscS family membrane protein
MGGLGLGGAALALASKDTVSNFFGSVTVLFDRPFEVGDWIITEGAEGTVEAVGFRSTRIRTFYNSLITLPNSLLTTSVVDNMGRRRFRRIKTTIGVQYDTTPEQLDAFCEGIRELIRRHPYTRKDYYHVYFNDFGTSSLDIMLYCFVACPDWAVELRERHRLLADIMRLANKLNVNFAFPTRTVHLFSETASEERLHLEQPTEAGQKMASEIVGRLPDQIPGPVKF